MIINYCQICKTKIDRHSKNCKLCHLSILNKKQKGKNHPNYKGGLPYCIDCGKQISRRKLLRCLNCYNKWRKISNNNNNFKDGRTLIKYYCKDCQKLIKDYHAIRCLKCSNIFNSKNHYTKIKYQEIYFKSGYEIAYAKWLDKNNIKWLYEPKTFDLGNTTYTPDFYLPEFKTYIEIKGYWYKDAKKKFKLFKRKYKDIFILIFDEKKLKQLDIIRR